MANTVVITLTPQDFTFTFTTIAVVRKALTDRPLNSVNNSVKCPDAFYCLIITLVFLIYMG